MASKRGKRKKEVKPMVFSAENYKLTALGVLLIIIGFTAMRLENEVYGLISLYLAPPVIMAGYIVVIFAILKRSKDDKDPSASTS